MNPGGSDVVSFHPHGSSLAMKEHLAVSLLGDGRIDIKTEAYAVYHLDRLGPRTSGRSRCWGGGQEQKELWQRAAPVSAGPRQLFPPQWGSSLSRTRGALMPSDHQQGVQSPCRPGLWCAFACGPGWSTAHASCFPSLLPSPPLILTIP